MPEVKVGSFTYDRPCGWCMPSKYVVKTTIATASPAPNANRLDVLTFQDLGYTTVGLRGQFTPGDAVYFVPGETLIPNELADRVGIRKLLANSRVKTLTLRGNRSEGLTIAPEVIEPFLTGLLKWEDPAQYTTSPAKRSIWVWRYTRLCDWLRPDRPSPEFCKFYDMPNLLNHPETFHQGEMVAISEKIHGMNMRSAVLHREWKWWAKPISPFLNPYAVYIGSHNVAFPSSSKNPWMTVYRKYLCTEDGKANIPTDTVFFEEVYGTSYGKPIQHLTYGLDVVAIRVFAAFNVKTHRYMLPQDMQQLCEDRGLPCVAFQKMPFESIAQMRDLAEAPSTMTDTHHREGIVICSMERPGVFAKLISFKYLENNARREGKE